MGKRNHDIILENNVEFITCRDCKHSEKWVFGSNQMLFCKLYDITMYKVDFCSNGEEKD